MIIIYTFISYAMVSNINRTAIWNNLYASTLPWILWGSCKVVIFSPFLSHANRPSSRFSQNSWHKAHNQQFTTYKHYLTNCICVGNWVYISLTTVVTNVHQNVCLCWSSYDCNILTTIVLYLLINLHDQKSLLKSRSTRSLWGELQQHWLSV